MRPSLLGRERSVGTGDRLGLSTPGHVRAFQHHDHIVTPVFAQQSIREMDRLGRSAEAVLDDAPFGCVEAGWTGRVGSDTDQVTGDIADVVPWEELEHDPEHLVRPYEGYVLQAGREWVTITREDLLRAAVKYGAAIADTMKMSRHLHAGATGPVEIEVAVDETAYVTNFAEHYYMAAELQRLGLDWVSFAPLYADGFEKGLEYLGDVAALEANLRGHRAVARMFGDYKISLHSGSDKFSIYPMAVGAIIGLIHLKTSGTTYLCALEVVAERNPDLLRAIYQVSREAYRKASASYQVSADVDRAPEMQDVRDEDVPELVAESDTRQIPHVGYGDVLTHTDGAGKRHLDEALREVLAVHHELHVKIMEVHIGRHLAAFAQA